MHVFNQGAALGGELKAGTDGKDSGTLSYYLSSSSWAEAKMAVLEKEFSKCVE